MVVTTVIVIWEALFRFKGGAQLESGRLHLCEARDKIRVGSYHLKTSVEGVEGCREASANHFPCRSRRTEGIRYSMINNNRVISEKPRGANGGDVMCSSPGEKGHQRFREQTGA